MPIDARPTLAAPDDDPHLWLEEIEGARALAWVDEQNERTLARFASTRFAADRDTLAAIYDRPDNIPFVGRRGGALYNLWKDANNPRGLWRRTSLKSFLTEEPAWEILLDLDALAAQEKEDWIWGGAASLPPAHERAILRLSRGGSDAAVLREFDLAAKDFVADGFYLPEAKGGADWLDRDTLLLSSAYGAGMTTRSGYSRTVRMWRRGEPIDRAPLLFETAPENMVAAASVDRSQATETVWFIERTGFFDQNLRIGDRHGPKAKLDLPTDISIDAHRGWVAVKRRTPWRLGQHTYPPDTVFGISLSALLAGERAFTVIFEPGERRALQHFFWADGRLVLSILDELRPVFEVVEPSASGWARTHIGGLPEIGVATVWRFDIEEAEGSGELLANVEEPLTPASFMLIERGKAPALLKQAPRTFSADGLAVSRHEAVSIDGERIPYVQVGPKAETGDAPMHLTGYGGFNIPVLPRTTLPSASFGSNAAERASLRTCAAAANSAAAGTRPAAAPARRAPMTISPPSPPISSAAASPALRGLRPRAARTAAFSSPTCWCAIRSGSGRCSAPSR